MDRINLFGLTLEQLQELCSNAGFPKFTAKQLCDWLYKKHVYDIDEMTNLSLKQREQLKAMAYVYCPQPIDVQISSDGTKKYLFDALSDVSLSTSDRPSGRYVECVMIPDGERSTVCVSCQRGCRMGCRFCVTGRQGLHGSLKPALLVAQVVAIAEREQLTNVVYMGMGEPMDNLESVLASIRILTEPWGLGWSARRITVSSVGVTPRLKTFIEQCACHLAISLHNPFPKDRQQLMPAEGAYPISGVIALLKQYDWSGQRRLSMEYTMFRGVNDSLTHAAEIVRLLRGLHCRVNLIRFHESDGVPLHSASRERMVSFQNYLVEHGIICTIRASRGEDIMAACGLLAGKAEGKSVTNIAP